MTFTEADIPLMPLKNGVTVQMLRACRWRYVPCDDMWVSPEHIWYYPPEITVDKLGLSEQVRAAEHLG